MSQECSDIDVEKIANGDEPEWKKLFEQYYQILVKQAYSIINDIHLANDIADTVLAKLWKQKSTVTNIKSLGAYLIRAARNEALTYVQKVANRREVLYPSGIEILTRAAKSNDPEVRVLQEELRKIILVCIEKLTPKQRKVIDLILLNTTISTRKLGRIIGCSHKNVQAIIGRIRIRFQKIYKLLEE